MSPMDGERATCEGSGWPFYLYLAGLLLLGVATVGEIGITWDEPNYFGSSYLYLSWFGGSSRTLRDGGPR